MEFSKLKVAVIQMGAIFILIAAALIAYAVYSENRAEKHANEFCDRLKVGQEVKGLLEHAVAAGADDRRTRWHTVQHDGESLPIVFTGATPISRHVCSVMALNGKLTQKEYVYLD
jgi:hypothetical protein